MQIFNIDLLCDPGEVLSAIAAFKVLFWPEKIKIFKRGVCKGRAGISEKTLNYIRAYRLPSALPT